MKCSVVGNLHVLLYNNNRTAKNSPNNPKLFSNTCGSFSIWYNFWVEDYFQNAHLMKSKNSPNYTKYYEDHYSVPVEWTDGMLSYSLYLNDDITAKVKILSNRTKISNLNRNWVWLSWILTWSSNCYWHGKLMRLMVSLYFRIYSHTLAEVSHILWRCIRCPL